MEKTNWKDEFLRLPGIVQEYLLTDRTVKWREGERSRIIWATDGYAGSGEAYGAKQEITVTALTAPDAPEIRPMAEKREEERKERVKKRAEVFTPSWVCNLQNNLVDDAWFGRQDVFNHVTDAETHQWEPVEGQISFAEKGGKSWRHYVDRKVLEITCGEAPYLVSRYDTVTGEPISLARRIGMLDRKLRVVGENAETEEEWRLWARRAMEATYGYEYQGDSLLLARMNLMLTYLEYRKSLWESEPDVEELRDIARVISWNLWQMDGLSKYLPVGSLSGQFDTSSLFGEHPETPENDVTQIQSRIHNWRSKETYAFGDLGIAWMGVRNMKFDVVIGNPPYEEQTSQKKTANGQKPVRNIFHYFQLQAEKVCKSNIILIYPGGAMDSSSGKRLKRIWA